MIGLKTVSIKDRRARTEKLYTLVQGANEHHDPLITYTIHVRRYGLHKRPSRFCISTSRVSLCRVKENNQPASLIQVV